jgi:hypothetical protein
VASFDVRFGSKADMCSAKRHVRFTPNSGHVRCKEGCPLSANSGHRPDLLDHLICTQQKLFGDRQTQRFGGGQIDD